MKGRISGFSYDSKKHIAHFSLYVPKTSGKLRRERTVQAESREEAIRLWQVFRHEISGKPSAPEPPSRPRVITFAAFVTEYLEKICARRAKKTLEIYRTIAFTRLIPKTGSSESRMDAGGSRGRIHPPAHEEDEKVGGRPDLDAVSSSTRGVPEETRRQPTCFREPRRHACGGHHVAAGVPPCEADRRYYARIPIPRPSSHRRVYARIGRCVPPGHPKDPWTHFLEDDRALCARK
jgi:hypothetical protein